VSLQGAATAICQSESMQGFEIVEYPLFAIRRRRRPRLGHRRG